MKLTLFSKTIRTREGKAYSNFVSTLTRKDGTKQYVTVKYSGEDSRLAFNAKKCPYIIEVEKGNANLTAKKRNITDRTTGEVREVINYTLWVKDYKESTEKFVDHSLDDFE